MAWINLTFFAEEKDIDLLSEELESGGALSIFIQDKNLNNSNEELIFGEPHSGPNKFWATSQIQALFSDSVDIKRIQHELISNFKDINFVFNTSFVSETDWVKLSQSQFKPIYIKNRIEIVQSWNEIENPKLINIILDPGLAFGTGAHPTTHLCTEWLIDNVSKEKKVLDYGCGSGILAIAAYKLGAKTVKGPSPLSASTKPAAVNAATKELNSGVTIARSTIFCSVGIIGLSLSSSLQAANVNNSTIAILIFLIVFV